MYSSIDGADEVTIFKPAQGIITMELQTSRRSFIVSAIYSFGRLLA
jgi:hypothetical protein